MVSHGERREHSGNINLALALLSTSLLYNLRGLRVSFFSRHANLKVGVPSSRSIAPSRKEEALTPRWARTKVYRAVAKRRSAYAAM